MFNGNTLDKNKNTKFITTFVQKNLIVSGASNSEIIQGIKNGNKEYYSCANFNNFIAIDLQDEYFVKAIKLCFWHYDNRYYTYECWVSKDSNNWNEIFSGYEAQSNDTIIIMDSIRYIKLKGKNTKNDNLHIINFKII